MAKVERPESGQFGDLGAPLTEGQAESWSQLLQRLGQPDTTTDSLSHYSSGQHQGLNPDDVYDSRGFRVKDHDPLNLGPLSLGHERLRDPFASIVDGREDKFTEDSKFIDRRLDKVELDPRFREVLEQTEANVARFRRNWEEMLEGKESRIERDRRERELNRGSYK